jgi:integrase
MAIHKLSHGFVQTVKKNGMYGDGGNLWLKVTNNGSAKSWVFRYDHLQTKKEQVMGLGSVSTWDIVEAREKARKYRQLLDEGKDPKTERARAKLDEEIEAGRARTVREVVDEFFRAKIAYLGKHKRHKHSQVNFWSHMKVHVLPAIGDRPFAKVTQSIILNDMGFERFWHEHDSAPRQLLSFLRRIFSYAITKGYYMGDNPMTWEDNLENVLPRKTKKGHFARLPYSDAPRFVVRLRAHHVGSTNPLWMTDSGRSVSGLLIEFVVLSAVRVSDATHATWDQMEGLGGPRPVWIITEHKGTEKPVRVPITKPMLAILEEMKRSRGNVGLVFPSILRGQRRPFTDRSLIQFLKRLKWETNITMHGFRTTFADWARASNYSQALIETAHGHIIKTGGGNAYADDDLLEQRRPMMEHWGRYCTQPPADGVINLQERRNAS